MARAKVESTADAVEEKKTDNAEDTAPVKAEEVKAPAESEYTIEEGVCRSPLPSEAPAARCP